LRSDRFSESSLASSMRKKKGRWLSSNASVKGAAPRELRMLQHAGSIANAATSVILCSPGDSCATTGAWNSGVDVPVPSRLLPWVFVVLR
jgi:hypothetical protein